MIMNLIEFNHLIKEFELLPQSLYETTFMNICRHSKSRFEEICSRILAFYLQPSNEHGLSDLIISSFFDIIQNDNQFIFYKEQISVNTEVYIEEKSLDILVKGVSFALGIENKINAEVYNPLHIYKKLIEQSHENNYKVVLSVREIKKEYELKNIKENGFTILYYKDLFQAIKNNIGNYYSNANSKYITFLYDFINTLENMSKSTIINDPQSLFFFENSSKIDKLIVEYNNHKERILNIQKSSIATLKEEISNKTSVNWWTYQEWDLGYNSFDSNKPKIGIESNYEVHSHDPLKVFRIYITTWDLKSWYYYEADILKKYNRDKYTLDLNSRNRAYLHMDIIKNNDQELIINKLYEYYAFLKELVESK